MKNSHQQHIVGSGGGENRHKLPFLWIFLRTFICNLRTYIHMYAAAIKTSMREEKYKNKKFTTKRRWNSRFHIYNVHCMLNSCQNRDGLSHSKPKNFSFGRKILKSNELKPGSNLMLVQQCFWNWYQINMKLNQH